MNSGILSAASSPPRAGNAAGSLAVALLLLLMTSCSSDMDLSPRPQSTAGSSDRLLFGAYTYGAVWGGMGPVLALESALGRRLDIVHWYAEFSVPWEEVPVSLAAEGGRRPLLSWEPVTATVEEIAAGRHDEHLRAWARGAMGHGSPIYVRPFPEMNGEWTPWNGNPAALVTAWRRMVDLFREEGAHNVRWVWAPNVTDEPRTEGNRMELYYPGDGYVDVLALDGFNWGSTREWSSWTSFESIFAAGYERVTRLGGQPVWITETASAERGGDKAGWIREMFATDAFPRLEAIVWFNEDKEADWRIESSPLTVQAFRQAAPDIVLSEGF